MHVSVHVVYSVQIYTLVLEIQFQENDTEIRSGRLTDIFGGEFLRILKKYSKVADTTNSV